MEEIVYKSYEKLKKYANCTGKYVSYEEITEMTKALRKKEYYNEELLRVVLVGRINAGKSTLTNALLGKNIAHIRGRESTSWNTAFYPSNSEFCIATDLNDDVEELTLEQFTETFNSEEKRKYFLQDKKSIDIFFKTNDIDFILLDIPGFVSRNKENEITALDAVRQADLALLVIPADTSISGDDIAIYNELIKQKIPVEILISKADYRTDDEIQELQDEIMEIFSIDKDVNYISGKNCIKGDERALDDRRRLIDSINQYKVRAKKERERNNTRFEEDCIRRLKKIQEKALFEVDRRFAKKFQERVVLYEKATKLSKIIRERMWNGAIEKYCEPYKNDIINKMVSMPIEECKLTIDKIINDNIPEEYVVSYWQEEVKMIYQWIEEIWVEELEDTKELNQYINVLKNSRSQFETARYMGDERLVGGIKTSAGIGTALSFYQAVLGPAAEYITLGGAFTTVGLPLMALGVGVSLVVEKLLGSGEKCLTHKEAERILTEALQKNYEEMVYFFVEAIEKINNECILKGIEIQESNLKNSLPENIEDVDESIFQLETIGAELLNRELVLRDKLEFYSKSYEKNDNVTGCADSGAYEDGEKNINCVCDINDTNKVNDVDYVNYKDYVEGIIDCFINRLNDIKGAAYIDTSNRIPFMPILFLSDKGKEHLLAVITDMCKNPTSFENKIKNTFFESSYVYEDENVGIYFWHKPGQKKIVLEYIDVYERDKKNVEQFMRKIREGSILSDCQMRRKIISDISRAKKSVYILVPWMNEAVKTKSNYYKNTMLEAIEKALQNGAIVTIGFGNSENCTKKNEKKSRDIMDEIIKNNQDYYDNKKLIFYKNSYTHEKFLVVDDRIAMCGSYNFLSNNGKFDDKSAFNLSVQKKHYIGNTYGYSDESEHPGESMKITENIESIQLILERVNKKYQ